MNGAGGKQETLGIRYANYVKPTVTIGGVEYTVYNAPTCQDNFLAFLS